MPKYPSNSQRKPHRRNRSHNIEPYSDGIDKIIEEAKLRLETSYGVEEG